MNLLEKLYTLIIFLAVVIGLSIGQVELIRANAESFIVPVLVAMLYITFLQIPIEEIKKAFRNLKFTYTSILINFVWTPVLAWLLAMVFLGDNPSLYIGFLMLMVTPCTDWYLIFTGMAKGNVALSTAILPLNLILQVLLLPVYLLLFGGTTGVIELGYLVESILIVLFIPMVLAVLTKYIVRNKQQL
jgi:arsenite transporter